MAPEDAETSPAEHSGSQLEARNLFEASAGYWEGVYGDPGLDGTVYRRRHDRICAWLRREVRSGARLLEVGCGAGFLSIELARLGYDVIAVDSAGAMLSAARRNAEQAGLGDRIRFEHADATALPFPDASFDAVVAVGVLPWLAVPALAVAELSRVARAGAAVVVTADNDRRLTRLLDPRLNPRLERARGAVKDALAAAHLRDPEARPPRSPHRHTTTDEVDDLLSTHGLTLVTAASVGFGPFTIWGRRIFPERLSVALDRRLQGAADGGMPLLRSRGSQYLVLTRK